MLKADDPAVLDPVNVGERGGCEATRGLMGRAILSEYDDHWSGVQVVTSDRLPLAPIGAEPREDVVDDVFGAVMAAAPREALILDPDYVRI